MYRNDLAFKALFKRHSAIQRALQLCIHFLYRVDFCSNWQKSEMEFKELELRFKSAKTRFKLSAGLNLETFDTILSGTNHI